MARIRNIKPSFFEDEKIASLPYGARLLFIGLWTRCDLRGVFEHNPKIITASLFAYDEGVTAEVVMGWMGKLEAMGLVASFEASGKRWGFVPHFSDHQCISKIERDQDAKARNRFPDPPLKGTITKTVPETVSETLDVGRRTQDVGHRREPDENAIASGERPPPTPLQKNPRDLLIAHTGHLEFFRGNGGMAEAEAKLAAAVELYGANLVDQAITARFRDSKSAVHIDTVLDVCGLHQDRLRLAATPPPPKPNFPNLLALGKPKPAPGSAA